MTDAEAAAVLRRMFDEWWDIDGDRDERAAIERAIEVLAKERHICPTCGEYG